MSNLANGRVILKFKNSVLVQKNSCSLYSNFILNLYKVNELIDWPRNHANNVPLKKLSTCCSQISKKRNENQNCL